MMSKPKDSMDFFSKSRESKSLAKKFSMLAYFVNWLEDLI